ncbi:MAG TPA: hypothetical protein VFW63_13750, partial [Acidimicrobiales bacterium]|nr:hypothetical protein [Acidimicrobiales bacterium]
AASSPFDTGRLGPAPGRSDTGQIRSVPSSSLPSDLSWAADDVGSRPEAGGPSSPFAGLGSRGSGRSRPSEGEVAPHVAAMSPEARAAVQSSVGNSGGSRGVGGRPGDDIAQRSPLIGFLSSVR